MHPAGNFSTLNQLPGISRPCTQHPEFCNQHPASGNQHPATSIWHLASRTPPRDFSFDFAALYC
jgi:hypothetical protein